MSANTGATTTNRQPVLLAEIILLVFLLALFVFKALLPAWRVLHTDFPNYYLVARLLRSHYSMGRIYDWIWLQRIKDHWMIQQPLVGFVGLTPFSALPLVPLAGFDAMQAKRVWLIINLAILSATLVGLRQIASLKLYQVTLVALLAIIPLRNNFLLGQMHLVLLGLLVLAYWLNARKMWFSCALTLAVAASLKIYPIFFVFYFLRKRQWKTAVVLAGSTLVLFALCFLVFGSPVMRVFLFEQFPLMLRGEVTNPFSLSAPSASSFFHRLFLEQIQFNPHPLLFSPLLYALLYPLWQMSLLSATLFLISPRDSDPSRRALEWASWICLLLTLSTQPASYHFVALIFVVLLALPSIHDLWHRSALLIAYFVACNLHPSISSQRPVLALVLDFLPYWGVLALLFCLLAALRDHQPERGVRGHAWPRARIAWTLGGFSAILCLVSETTFAHVRSWDNSHYLAIDSSGAYGQFDPHWVAGHLLSVGMFLDGYRVEDEQGRRYQTAPRGLEEDQVAIASSPRAAYFWIEAVSKGHSRLVELSESSDGSTQFQVAAILDAESPALSPDGRILVFLREMNGVGRAWMVALDDKGQAQGAPFPITDEGVDVWKAEFDANGSILYSAIENGNSHLFVTHPGEAPRRIYSREDAMDSPAFYGRGGLVAFRQRRGNYWQLFAGSLTQAKATQITFGYCSAYDPAWSDDNTLIYISDCGRGIGLGALAARHFNIVQGESIASYPLDISTEGKFNEARQ